MTAKVSLHPEVSKMLEAAAQLATPGTPSLWDIPPAMARIGASTKAKAWNAGSVDGAGYNNLTINTDRGQIAARHYQPGDRGTQNAALIYAHGGGWIVGDLDFEHLKLLKLCAWSGVDIISIDYALAPEHPFPEPRDDIVAAAVSIASLAGSLAIDPDRLGIGGASAGANLALSAAIALRDAGQPLSAIALFYGVYDLRYTHPSFIKNATGFVLETRAMEYFRSLYVGDSAARWSDPEASPGLARLEGLAPVFLNAVTNDPLCDDSHALADRLTKAGVPHELHEYTDTIHGFTSMSAVLPHADKAIHDAANWLKQTLET
ncbi:alpha/beta hydrolase [Hyphomonas johnsonii]|uniref:Alpha/beta hydrolase fold protein n=1 Tax=Hyphomonas johnsonii MHS-2 TaxID=1280950 RepID=A0A059FS85_9PROT|nr:alpha/beta hydrolase [Hyphomonas johnsonii]KCZ93472.1 alpha/beta hydrolase fold protein [Hyphomonas johnsonii MHS-2]